MRCRQVSEKEANQEEEAMSRTIRKRKDFNEFRRLKQLREDKKRKMDDLRRKAEYADMPVQQLPR